MTQNDPQVEAESRAFSVAAAAWLRAVNNIDHASLAGFFAGIRSDQIRELVGGSPEGLAQQEHWSEQLGVTKQTVQKVFQLLREDLGVDEAILFLERGFGVSMDP